MVALTGPSFVGKGWKAGLAGSDGPIFGAVQKRRPENEGSCVWRFEAYKEFDTKMIAERFEDGRCAMRPLGSRIDGLAVRLCRLRIEAETQ